MTFACSEKNQFKKMCIKGRPGEPAKAELSLIDKQGRASLDIMYRI